MYKLRTWGKMQKKIITKTDSNLITLQYKEVTEEAIIENELLVKELLFILKSGGNAISKEDLKTIADYNTLNDQMKKILNHLGLEKLSEIETLIEKQNQLIGLKNEQLNAKNDEFQSLTQEYQIEVEKLKKENEKLEAIGKNYKRKFEGQKNRKVVRLVDKVAKR